MVLPIIWLIGAGLAAVSGYFIYQTVAPAYDAAVMLYNILVGLGGMYVGVVIGSAIGRMAGLKKKKIRIATKPGKQVKENRIQAKKKNAEVKNLRKRLKPGDY